ncbi:unnamed protein product [Cuscuta campestris]|uniref:Uncharacterized protein n=1 Tax=Cuscuta campestris TaxID=132261 RepID=A0A484K1S2_9ASTE|nr:unnamed protein product [Cuscuta campestris]
MVQTRSNIPTTSHVVREEPGKGNRKGGITSAPDTVQALFADLALGLPRLHTVPNTEHAATSQHKGKKTRRSGRRPGKALVIEEVLVEDVSDGEDDESSECRVSAFKRLGGEEARVSAFNRLNRGPEGRPGEKVSDFIVRWEKEARDVHGADDQALVEMFQEALSRGEVRKELRKNPPPTYPETLVRTKFLALEEFDDASDSAPAKRASVDSGEIAKKRKKKKDYTAGDSIEAEGVTAVPVIVGDGAHKAKLKMEFMVVSINNAHNMVLGWPGLEDMGCVISPYYLCMKFPTPSRIGVARGYQKLARSCYVRITKKLPRDETLVVHAQEEMRMPRDETLVVHVRRPSPPGKLEARPKAKPAEEVKEVPLDPGVPERKVKIGASLTGSQQKHLVDVLQRDLRVGTRGYARGGSQDHMPPVGSQLGL